MQTRKRLRIAAQKSGRLSKAGLDLLSRCGLRFRHGRDRLYCDGENLPIDLLLVRDDDIPGLISSGACDLGIVGRNVLAEAMADTNRHGGLRELRALGFARCRLALALPQDEVWRGPQQLEGRRIATSYPRLLQGWLQRHGVQADPVVLSGAVEIAPRLGSADLVCDLVETGTTLAANQLREVVTLLDSEAVLAGAVATPERSEEHTSELQSRGHLVCRLLLEKKKSRHNRKCYTFVTHIIDIIIIINNHHCYVLKISKSCNTN